jgi:hypothetical protein
MPICWKKQCSDYLLWKEINVIWVTIATNYAVFFENIYKMVTLTGALRSQTTFLIKYFLIISEREKGSNNVLYVIHSNMYMY